MWRYAAHLTPVGASFYTSARVNDTCFSAFGCRRYSVYFTAVGVGFYATSRVNAASFSAVGVDVIPPILLLLVPPFTRR